MVSEPPMMAVHLSNPKAIPPCGGAPKRKALSRKPNCFCASSAVKPRVRNISDCVAGSWIRIEPPPISVPLMTRS